MKDRIPPNCRDTELSIIGSCVEFPVDCLPQCQAVITETEFFYDPHCQIVWDALGKMQLHEINIVSIGQKLKEAVSFLTECQSFVTSAANITYWLDIAREKHIARKLIATATRLISDAYEFANGTELIDKAEREILAIRPIQIGSSDISSLVNAASDRLNERAMIGHGNITGLSTDLIDLDRLTDGLHGGEMVVIAGLPSTGKTCLAVNIAVANALKSVPSAIFSAEMRPVQLVVRSLCSEARANFHYLTNGDVPKLIMAGDRVRRAPLYIEQASGLTIGQVGAIARRLKQKHGIKIMVIDYIQLLKGKGDNREQEISSISKGIKQIALELDVTVLALSQLTDDGKLRESRAIGQDGDSVWKITNDGEWQSKNQPVILSVEKCRDGATGTVKLMFFKEYTRFGNFSKIEESE